MDMRAVLRNLNIQKIELEACLAASLRRWSELPFDIIWYFSLVGTYSIAVMFSSLDMVLKIHEEVRMRAALEYMEASKRLSPVNLEQAIAMQHQMHQFEFQLWLVLAISWSLGISAIGLGLVAIICGAWLGRMSRAHPSVPE
jgi:hypothetical protein